MLIVDAEFQSLIPPLTDEERGNLRDQIIASGRADTPIDVWLGQDIIVDGHNRYAICSEFGLPYSVRYLPFDSREQVKVWMLSNQLSRRNLTADQLVIIELKHLGASKRPRDHWARAILTEAPDLAKCIERGDISVQRGWSELNLRRGRAAKTAAPKKKAPKGRIHIIVGDTQVKPGVPTKHLQWIGKYIAEQFVGKDVAIIHLGDHWDMPSLSSYDEGKRAAEGRRYSEDIEAGNAAFRLLDEPIANAMAARRWKPERHFLFGNHEDRISRACNDKAALEGKLSLDDCNTRGWVRHRFLDVLTLDGIDYCHYFYNPNTGRPYSGDNLHLRLKTIGRSFTMGHQQGLNYAMRPVGQRRHQGLVLGTTYLHDEDYLGPQGNAYWRGIVVCHQVEDGQYDPMFVSLDFLCRKFQGETLADYLKSLP